MAETELNQKLDDYNKEIIQALISQEFADEAEEILAKALAKAMGYNMTGIMAVLIMDFFRAGKKNYGF